MFDLLVRLFCLFCFYLWCVFDLLLFGGLLVLVWYGWLLFVCGFSMVWLCCLAGSCLSGFCLFVSCLLLGVFGIGFLLIVWVILFGGIVFYFGLCFCGCCYIILVVCLFWVFYACPGCGWLFVSAVVFVLFGAVCCLLVGVCGFVIALCGVELLDLIFVLVLLCMFSCLIVLWFLLML